MNSGSKPEMPPTVTEDPNSTSAIQFPKPGLLSVDSSAEGEEAHMVPPSHVLSIRSPVDIILGNFFLATFLISLIICIVSFIVTWFTVLRDARSINDQTLSNVTGVRLCLSYSVGVADACYRGR